MKSRLRTLAFVVATTAVAACGAILGIEDREPYVPDAAAETGVPVESGGSESGADVDDAGSDAPLDAPPDVTLYTCPDLTKVESCHACGGELVACPATKTCVTECRDNCATGPIACVSCAGFTDGGYVAVCSPDKTPAPSCPTSDCSCAGINAAMCPLGNMVCDASVCATCGDLHTGEDICKTGTGQMKCKLGTDGDPTKRYRCK